MGRLAERIAYIKGLSHGLSLDESTKEGKVLAEMIDVLGDVAELIELHDGAIDDLIESVGELGEDLEDLQDYMLDEDFDDYDDDFVEIECPSCNDTIFFDLDMITSDDPLTCPSCGAQIPLETDSDTDSDNEIASVEGDSIKF